MSNDMLKLQSMHNISSTAKGQSAKDRFIPVMIHILLILSAIAEVSLFSLVSSPFLGYGYCHDSSLFEIIGKYWAKGYIPYTDFWDSKGPYVFLVDAIAYSLGGKRGLYVLEIINLYITKLICFKTLSLKTGKIFACVLTIVCVSLCIPRFWYYGNNQSEWCLPYIAGITYCIFKYSLQEEKNFPVKYGYIIGLTVGVCMMSRPANALFTLIASFCVIIYLIYNKRGKNILHNCIIATLGVATVCLPFVIYFAIKHSLYDMIYATFLYNSKYVSSVNISSSNYVTSYMIEALFRDFYFVTMCVIAMCYKIQNKKYRSLIVFNIPIILSIICTCLIGLGFIHYYIVWMPISLCVIIDLKDSVKSKIVFCLLFSYMIIWSFMSMTTYILNDECLYAIRNDDQVKVQEICDSMVESIPESSTFLSINEPLQHELYLKYDIKPNNKYFYYQDTYADIDSSIRKDIVNDFKSNPPDYVLYSEINDVSFRKDKKIYESVYYDELISHYTVIRHVKAIEGNEKYSDIYLLKFKK